VALDANAVECEMGKFPSALACEAMACTLWLAFKVNEARVVGRRRCASGASGQGDDGKRVLGALRSNGFDTARRLHAVGTESKLVGLGMRACGRSVAAATVDFVVLVRSDERAGSGVALAPST
jgi:hypothetical protein